MQNALVSSIVMHIVWLSTALSSDLQEHNTKSTHRATMPIMDSSYQVSAQVMLTQALHFLGITYCRKLKGQQILLFHSEENVSSSHHATSRLADSLQFPFTILTAPTTRSTHQHPPPSAQQMLWRAPWWWSGILPAAATRDATTLEDGLWALNDSTESSRSTAKMADWGSSACVGAWI